MLLRIGNKTGRKTVVRQLQCLATGQSQRLGQGKVIVIQITAKIRGVVGIDHHSQTGIHQFDNIVLLHFFIHTQTHIRQRAHRSGNLCFAQVFYQQRVFIGAYAMVNAVYTQ